MSTTRMPLSCKVIAPASKVATVPVALPGSTVAAMVSAPTGPSPISVPSARAANAELGTDPLTTSVPLLTVVAPLYGLAPDRVMMLVPRLSNPPVPWMAPLHVVLLPLPPAIRRALPSWTVPAPSSEPTICATLDALNAAPAATRTNVFEGKALAKVRRSMPLLTKVEPTCADTRDMTVVPVPSLTRSSTLVPMPRLVMTMLPAPPR